MPTLQEVKDVLERDGLVSFMVKEFWSRGWLCLRMEAEDSFYLEYPDHPNFPDSQKYSSLQEAYDVVVAFIDENGGLVLWE